MWRIFAMMIVFIFLVFVFREAIDQVIKRARTCRTLRRGTAKRLCDECSKPRRVARAWAGSSSENSRFSTKTVAELRK